MNDNHSITLDKALKLFESHEYVYAQKLLNDLVKNYPQDAQIRHYQHVCNIKKYQNQLPSSFIRIIRGLLLIPFKVYAFFLFLTEDNMKAFQFYEKILKYNPLLINYYWQCITLLERMSKNKEVLFYLQEVLLINPANINALKKTGQMYLKQGHLSKAKKVFNTLKSLSPQDSEVETLLKHLSALETLRSTPFKTSS